MCWFKQQRKYLKNRKNYALVKKPDTKRTLVNTIEYGVKFYQVNTTIVNFTYEYEVIIHNII